MKPKKDILFVLDKVKEIIYSVEPGDLRLYTPNCDWKLGDLLGHMLYQLSWVPDIVTGISAATIPDPWRGNLLHSTPRQSWHRAAIAAREAIHRCDPNDIARLSYGDHSVRWYLHELAIDLLIHGWDVAQSIQTPFVFDETLAREMFDRISSRGDEIQVSGLFTAALNVPVTASYQVKLLALLGRSDKWRVT